MPYSGDDEKFKDCKTMRMYLEAVEREDPDSFAEMLCDYCRERLDLRWEDLTDRIPTMSRQT